MALVQLFQHRQPAMPQRVNYVNWSLGTLMGAWMKLPKHTHTHTHVEMTAHVKWGNWWKMRGVEKGKLGLRPFQQS